MLLERIRIAGITMIVAAMSVAGWKTFAVAPVEAAYDASIRPVSTSLSGGEEVLTIPVEIVEAGQAPRIHEIRVTR
jgi:hypothetical protein